MPLASNEMRNRSGACNSVSVPVFAAHNHLCILAGPTCREMAPIQPPACIVQNNMDDPQLGGMASLQSQQRG